MEFVIMEKTIVQYGLMKTSNQKILGFSTSSNENGDFCSDTKYILNDCAQPSWVVSTPEHAEYVRTHSTKWYNSSYDTPTHSYKADELSVIKIETKIEVMEIPVKIPTLVEWLTHKAKKDNGYTVYLNNPTMVSEYTLYDLQDYLRETSPKE